MIILALGSNLHRPEQQVKKAIKQINAHPTITVTHQSSLCWTDPLPGGPANQPLFVNAVISVNTTLDPHALLTELLAIETAMGRTRGEHWASRIIDIDILFYHHEIIQTPTLTIPHYDIENRDFLLKLLAEIAPHFSQ